jgi:putative SOS response-associated peptidase YedK
MRQTALATAGFERSGKATRRATFLADRAVLHDRMPVILEAADWPTWLDEASGQPAGLLRPAHDGVVRLWPVSRAVNSVRNNGVGLLAPI